MIVRWASCSAGGGAGAVAVAVDGGLTAALVSRSSTSFKHWRGGNAADTAVILVLDRDGPVLLSDLGVCRWWRPLTVRQTQAEAQLSHTAFWTSTTGLFCGELAGDAWRLETPADGTTYCMTSKNVRVLIKFLSMTTLFRNHEPYECPYA